MSEFAILAAQISALQDDLESVNTSLTTEGKSEISHQLRRAVLNRLTPKITEQRNGLDILKEQVKDGADASALWDSFLGIRGECTPIFRECLAFLHGALIRQAGMDRGLCLIADSLLADLSYRSDIPWNRLTIVADEHAYTDLSEIIRLRYPQLGIWSLPIVAHEFGHHVAEDVRGKLKPDPFEAIIQSEGGDASSEQNLRYLHEEFADLFAVHALGPAFAFSSILLIFDPASATKPDETHPASAERAYLILSALKKMDVETASRPQKAMIDYLDRVWESGLAAVGNRQTLAKQDIGKLNNRLNQLSAQVLDKSLSNVRYRSWSRAEALSSRLANGDSIVGIEAEKHTLIDIVNAAWISRARDESAADRIQDSALDLCLELIGPQNEDG